MLRTCVVLIVLYSVTVVLSFGAIPAAVDNTPHSTAEAVMEAYADCLVLQKSNISQKDLEGYKYFWVSTPEGKNRDKLRTAFKLQINLLSRESEIASFVEVKPWLWRIDQDELALDRATLEAARFQDPFFHKQEILSEDTILTTFWPGGVDSRTGEFAKRGKYREQVLKGKKAALASPQLPTKEIVALREMLYTEVPIVSAEWFLAQSARQISTNSEQTGLGYYDFLKLKDRDAFFKLLRFNERDSIELGKEMRAVAEFSKVSPNPRQLVRYQAASGAVHVALDTIAARKRGVAINNLDHEQFKHQIEEWYGFLANGLPATFLSNEKGIRANNAPADAAGFGDNSPLNESKDFRIHVNLACLRCHAGEVLKPIDDYIRKVYQSPLSLGNYDKKKMIRLRRQYFSKLDGALKKDREAYIEAFREVSTTRANPRGMTAGKAVADYSRSYHAYVDDPVTLEKSAHELGMTKEAWLKALKAQFPLRGSIDLRLAPLIPLAANPSMPIHRSTWEDVYQQAVEVGLGRVPFADPKANTAVLEKEKK